MAISASHSNRQVEIAIGRNHRKNVALVYGSLE